MVNLKVQKFYLRTWTGLQSKKRLQCPDCFLVWWYPGPPLVALLSGRSCSQYLDVFFQRNVTSLFPLSGFGLSHSFMSHFWVKVAYGHCACCCFLQCFVNFPAVVTQFVVFAVGRAYTWLIFVHSFCRVLSISDLEERTLHWRTFGDQCLLMMKAAPSTRADSEPAPSLA